MTVSLLDSRSDAGAGGRAIAGAIVGATVAALLCAVCLGLAFHGGAYTPGNWLLLMIGLAALAVLLSLTGPSLQAGRFQKVLLGLFAAQTVWTAASLLWAGSSANAWEEINRTLFFAVALALAFAVVRWAGARPGALTVMLAATTGVVALVIVIRLGTSADPLRFFSGGRLRYPVTYWNGLAALLMVGFWLALGSANAAGGTPPRGGRRARGRSKGEFPWWTRPAFLALGVVLVELALLPQSRGALWAFFLVVPFFVILSPHRFRALANLTIVVFPMIVFWDRINGVYVAIRDGTDVNVSLGRALPAIGFSVLIVAAAWAVTWLVERWLVPLPRRVAFWIGTALVVLSVLGAAGGLVYADMRTDGLGGYVSQRWSEFTSDKGTGGGGGSRFTEMSLNGRLTLWKVAGEAFLDHPVLGLGAQNFEPYYLQHRATLLEVKQPHSQPMQLLAELGFPGVALWLAFVALTLVRAGVLRFRASSRAERAVIAAMMTAVISWFIHSSADWLWQLAAVSLPAILLLGGLVGAGEPQAKRAAGEAGEAGAASAPSPALSPAPKSSFSRVRSARIISAFLAVIVIASAAFPYLSLRYSNLAIATGTKDLDAAVAQTRAAAWLDPTTTLPFTFRASVYETAARQAPAGSQASVGYRRLAAAAWVEATERDPSNWAVFYLAAVAFLALRDAVGAADENSVEDLTETARTYLREARRLNPLSPEIRALAITLDDEALSH